MHSLLPSTPLGNERRQSCAGHRADPGLLLGGSLACVSALGGGASHRSQSPGVSRSLSPRCLLCSLGGAAPCGSGRGVPPAVAVPGTPHLRRGVCSAQGITGRSGLLPCGSSSMCSTGYLPCDSPFWVIPYIRASQPPTPSAGHQLHVG